jgi:hypothetical protein
MIFGAEYKLWSCSLCNFLHSPVTSSLHTILILPLNETRETCRTRVASNVPGLINVMLKMGANCLCVTPFFFHLKWKCV